MWRLNPSWRPALMRVARVAATACVVLTASSCAATDVSAPASISMTISAATLTDTIGMAGRTLQVTITRSNYTGDVPIEVSGLPAGVTASASPTMLSGGTVSSTVTVTATSAAAPGAATLTVTASGTGVTAQTATIALSVLPPPSYTLAPRRDTVTVNLTATTSDVLAMSRTNFTGGVAFSAAGVPSGATVSFSPSPSTADSTIVSFDPGTAAMGTYTVHVTATATGMTDRTASFVVRILPAPAYTLTPDSTTATVIAGATTARRLRIARTNFTADVSLAASGAPSGMTVSFAPNPLVAADTAASVTIATTSAVVPGTYALTFTGTSTGLGSRTATLTVTVLPAASFTIQLDTTTATVYQSDSVGFRVHLTRTNFTGGVTITASGLPTGASVYTTPGPITGDTALLWMKAGNGAAGSYSATLTATGTDVPTRTVTVNATIAAQSAVSFLLCGTPTWVAYQSGRGADWHSLTPQLNGSYTFNISGVGGIAWARGRTVNGQPAYHTQVLYGNATDLMKWAATSCTPTTSTLTTVYASAVNTNGWYASIRSNAWALYAWEGAVYQMRLRAPSDVIAVRYGPDSKVIVRRDLSPASGDTLPVFDFLAAEALAPDTVPVSVAGTPAGWSAYGSISTFTANGSFYAGGGPVSGGAFPGSLLASAVRRTTDTYAPAVSANVVGLNGVSRGLNMYAFPTPTVPAAMTLPPVPGHVTFGSAAGTAGDLRITAAVPGNSSYDAAGYAAYYHWANGYLLNYTYVFAAASYYGGTPNMWHLDIPDMASAGYSASWGLADGDTVEAFAEIDGGNVWTQAPGTENHWYYEDEYFELTSLSANLTPMPVPASSAAPSPNGAAPSGDPVRRRAPHRPEPTDATADTNARSPDVPHLR